MASTWSSSVDPNALAECLRELEGERHPLTSPDRLRAAMQLIERRWRAWGLTVFSHGFSFFGERFFNLAARPAAFPPGPRLIVGAHVDTVSGTPGADDNATGVAALLELSRMSAGRAWRIPVEFLAFTLEEEGMVGSQQYAGQLRREGTRLLGMLSLEMLGYTEADGRQRYPRGLARFYPKTGGFIGVAANWRSRPLLKAVAAAMRGVDGLPVETLVMPGNGGLVPEARLSDHAPFWDAGYQALLVTDTAFLRNPHYHSLTDTVSTLDLPFFTKVVQGLAAALEALDQRGPRR
jgi:Zn-dependent M28 family amino/carboxypeptidase